MTAETYLSEFLLVLPQPFVEWVEVSILETMLAVKTYPDLT
jgi:hypothetical protein